MTFTGPPTDPVSVQEFYERALEEPDADTRRRLFADVRASNPASYQVWIKAAEVEEKWGADEAKLKTLLTRGVTVFKNPAGGGSGHGIHEPQRVTKSQWESEAIHAENNGKDKTAKALKAALNDAFQDG